MAGYKCYLLTIMKNNSADIRDNMRLILFTGDRDETGLGIMRGMREFINISENFPEYPEYLHNIISIKQLWDGLANALGYEKLPLQNLRGVKLCAPVCSMRLLWVLGANGKLYLKSARGLKSHKDVLAPPASAELRMTACILFTVGCGGRDIAPGKALGCFTASTLLHLGVDGSNTLGLGLQQDGFTAAGPWLMPVSGNSAKPLRASVFLNGDLLANATLKSVYSTAGHVLSLLSHSQRIMPGDMLALPLAGAFAVNKGDKISTTVEGFGTLTNTIGDD